MWILGLGNSVCLETMDSLLVLLSSHLKVWSIILGDKGAITLAQNCNLLLNVFYLILCFLQIYNFYSHHLFRAVVDAFVNLPKGTLSNPLLFGEVLLRVQPGILATFEQRKEWNACMNSWFLQITCKPSSCKFRCVAVQWFTDSFQRETMIIRVKPVIA